MKLNFFEKRAMDFANSCDDSYNLYEQPIIRNYGLFDMIFVYIGVKSLLKKQKKMDV